MIRRAWTKTFDQFLHKFDPNIRQITSKVKKKVIKFKHRKILPTDSVWLVLMNSGQPIICYTYIWFSKGAEIWDLLTSPTNWIYDSKLGHMNENVNVLTFHNIMWVKLGREKFSESIDGRPSMNSPVIVTEAWSVLALFNPLITPDYVLYARVHSCSANHRYWTNRNVSELPLNWIYWI